MLIPDAFGTPNYPTYTSGSTAVGSSSGLPAVALRSESRLLRKTLSSVPVIWQSELTQQYQELGEALNELTELEDDHQWKIDTPVYQVARYVATELLTHSYPAPEVFTHGTKSVVFNWALGVNNLYLTISSDRISALISTPKHIERRLDFSAKEFLASPVLLPAIRSAHLEKPVLSVTRATSEPSEFVD